MIWQGRTGKEMVCPEDVESLIRQETKAVIVVHASNVCGTIVPIEEIGNICERAQYFLCRRYGAESRERFRWICRERT